MMQRRMRDTFFSASFLKRLLIYGIMTVLLTSAQCAFFPMLDFCPRTPDLILAMLVAIALLDSETPAAVCAVFGGFFLDSVGGWGVALSPIIYFLTIILICSFTGKMLKSFPSFAVIMLPALLCRMAATYICMWLSDRALPGGWIFTKVLLPEMLCTVICAIPIYFLVKLCTKPLKSHGKFTF